MTKQFFEIISNLFPDYIINVQDLDTRCDAWLYIYSERDITLPCWARSVLGCDEMVQSH